MLWLSGSVSASASSSSETLQAKIDFFDERRKKSLRRMRSSSDISRVRAGFPSFRCGRSLSMRATSALDSLSPLFAFFERDWRRLSMAEMSARMSSALMISMSRSGSTLPSSWMMSSFSKQRMTWTMASTSRMVARNLFPRPAPSEAPSTSPAMSTNSMAVGISFLEPESSLSTASRSSGTLTTPMFGSMVQNG